MIVVVSCPFLNMVLKLSRLREALMMVSLHKNKRKIPSNSSSTHCSVIKPCRAVTSLTTWSRKLHQPFRIWSKNLSAAQKSKVIMEILIGRNEKVQSCHVVEVRIFPHRNLFFQHWIKKHQ